MTTNECRHETWILEALAAGAWSAELQSHADECQSCGELVLVDRALQAEARLAAETTPPDAEWIWRRFEIESGDRRLRAATLPIRLLERFTVAAGVLSALYALFVLWPSLGAWLAASGSSLAGSIGGTPDLGAPTLLLLAVGGFLCVFLHGLYQDWAET